MKSNWTKAAIVLVFALVIAPQGFAQTHLNNLLKSCETRPTVDMNIVMNRNKDTGDLTKVVKTVTINNDKRLVDEFLTAFSRDKEKADKVIENIKAGKTIPSLYQFNLGEKRISYSFSGKDESNATVTYIERSGSDNSFMDMFSINSSGDIETWGEEFGQRMEAWSSEFAPKIEAWAKEFEPQMQEFVKKLENAAGESEIIINGEVVKPKSN